MGIGTPQDGREALDWYKKAAMHGDKRAMDKLRVSGQPRAQRDPMSRQPNPPPVPSKHSHKSARPSDARVINKDKKSTTSLRAERPPRGSSVDASRRGPMLPLPHDGRPDHPVRQRSNSFSGETEQQEFGVPHARPFGGGPAGPAYASHSLPGPHNNYGRAVPIEQRLGEGAGRLAGAPSVRPQQQYHQQQTALPPPPPPPRAAKNGDMQNEQPVMQHRLPPGAGYVTEQMDRMPAPGPQYQFQDEAQRRRDVLQKRKAAAGTGEGGDGPGEDKDCIIM
ncbi:Chitin synthase 4 [Microbotryomycetes sp. JL201]|nr:Chitin synthase 4 [Microbotryomycetes sp. JL201]